jgi:hypothetical protein
MDSSPLIVQTDAVILASPTNRNGVNQMVSDREAIDLIVSWGEGPDFRPKQKRILV